MRPPGRPSLKVKTDVIHDKGFRAAIRPILMGVAVLAAVSGWPPGTVAQTVSEITSSLQAIANRNHQLTDQEVATAQRLGNPHLAADYQRRGLRRLETEIGTQTIHWISRYPGRARDIAAAAVQSAPTIKDLLTRRLFSTFPGLASEVAAGSGVAAPAVLSQPTYPINPPIAVTASPPLFARAPAPRPTFASAAAPQPPSAPPTMEDDLSALGVEAISDPIEPVNRVIFAFNDAIDIMIFRPVAAVYGFVAPNVVKSAVRRVFDNLNEPVVFANDLLQFDIVDAGVAAGRFAINSTAGVLGIFDVAQIVGLEPHQADFGQTLHSYGLGAGPYVVLPLLGPNTARDAIGNGVDVFLQPLTYILEPEVNLAISGTKAIVQRETLLKPLDVLRASSVDYYAALRAAYYQNRSVGLRKGRGGDSGAVDALFDQAE